MANPGKMKRSHLKSARPSIFSGHKSSVADPGPSGYKGPNATTKSNPSNDTTGLNTGKKDCECCYEEYPISEMAYCTNAERHFFCFDCARQNVETLIGDGACRPACIGGGDCKAPFHKETYKNFLDQKLYDKLLDLQQKDDIRVAMLAGMEECPFCDFKMEMESVEIQPVFFCQAKDCGKGSCRLCKEIWHEGQTCEELKKEKEKKVITIEEAKRLIQEAVTEKVMHRCNECKAPYVKATGCNLIKCATCSHSQCYICRVSVYNDHEHFYNNSPCKMFSNTAEQEDKEAKTAEKQAIKKLVRKYPHLNASDLKLEFSKSVKKLEKRKIAQAHRPELGAHFAAGTLDNDRMQGQIAGQVEDDFDPWGGFGGDGFNEEQQLIAALHGHGLRGHGWMGDGRGAAGQIDPDFVLAQRLREEERRIRAQLDRPHLGRGMDRRHGYGGPYEVGYGGGYGGGFGGGHRRGYGRHFGRGYGAYGYGGGRMGDEFYEWDGHGGYGDYFYGGWGGGYDGYDEGWFKDGEQDQWYDDGW